MSVQAVCRCLTLVPGTGDAGHLLAAAGRAGDVDAEQQGALGTVAPAEVWRDYRGSPQVSDGEDCPLLHWSEARGVPGPTVGVAKETEPGGLVRSRASPADHLGVAVVPA